MNPFIESYTFLQEELTKASNDGKLPYTCAITTNHLLTSEPAMISNEEAISFQNDFNRNPNCKLVFYDKALVAEVSSISKVKVSIKN